MANLGTKLRKNSYVFGFAKLLKSGVQRTGCSAFGQAAEKWPTIWLLLLTALAPQKFVLNSTMGFCAGNTVARAWFPRRSNSSLATQPESLIPPYALSWPGGMELFRLLLIASGSLIGTPLSEFGYQITCAIFPEGAIMYPVTCPFPLMSTA